MADVKKILVIGQSNALGVISSGEYTDVFRDGIFKWRSDIGFVVDGVEPIGGSGATFMASMSNTLKSTGFKNSIIYCNKAVSGIGITAPAINNWSDKTDTCYTGMLSDAFVSANDFDAIFFYAGETDIQDGIAEATVKAGLLTLISNLRSDIGDCPIFFVLPYIPAEPAGDNTAVRNAITSAVSESTGCYVVGDAQGKTLDGDGIHLSKVGQSDLGIEIAGNANVKSIDSGTRHVYPIENIRFSVVPACESQISDSRESGDCFVYGSVGVTSSIPVGQTSNGFIKNGLNSLYRFSATHQGLHTNGTIRIGQGLVTILKAKFRNNVVNTSCWVIGSYTSATNNCFIRKNNTNRLLFSFHNGTEFASLSSTASLTSNVDYDCLVIIDGPNGVARFYINGVLDSTQAVTLPSSPSSWTNTKIGGWTTTQGLNGDLFYAGYEENASYSDSDILSNYLIGNNLGGLVATDNGDGTMALSVPAVEDGTNYHKSKYFPFANSFASWSKRKRNKR